MSTLEEFKNTTKQDNPPKGLSGILLALWYDHRGQWHEAHEIAQEITDPGGSWMHAYLHRKEGDFSNASYWYRRANREVPKNTLEEEWEVLVRAFLK